MDTIQPERTWSVSYRRDDRTLETETGHTLAEALARATELRAREVTAWAHTPGLMARLQQRRGCSPRRR